MSDQATSSIGAGAAQESPDTAGTILIVDDEPTGRETLAALLLNQRYQLHFAANGAEALTQVAELQPDLVLLDVMMPGIDGFEVCRRIRAAPLFGEVPIILLTALDDRESRLRGIGAGADDFISKPFDRIELRARVKTITRLNRYQRLLAERAKLAHVIEFAPDGLLIVDQVGTIALANPATVHLLGAGAAGELLGRHITSLLAPDQRAACQVSLERVIAGAGAVRLESMLQGPGGLRTPIEMHIGFLSWDGRPAAQIIARDIIQRKQAELLEEERRLIGYELHDGLAQIVISTHQHLQAFAARHRPRALPTRAELDRVLDLARRSVTEIRRVIAGLRPTALDDFGLAAALRMHVAALQADGWAISFRESLGTTRLAPTVETVIYRIAQEALTNVRKHAQTTRVAVRLAREDHWLRLEVQDWGCGFEPTDLVSGAGFGERIGLRGMRERAAILGGRWSVHSSPGTGTLIVAEIPLPPENEGEIGS
ncbi:MAG TPA: response regulator [Roseiflexaceae bacterium]|nr:response regulator [Roseiflexaceae bacterium]